MLAIMLPSEMVLAVVPEGDLGAKPGQRIVRWHHVSLDVLNVAKVAHEGEDLVGAGHNAVHTQHLDGAVGVERLHAGFAVAELQVLAGSDGAFGVWDGLWFASQQDTGPDRDF